jgi:molybdopterin-guanine dinucleotide biosynthesis protein A
MKYKIPAVLFAGGKSSRMGKDKALLPFAHYNSLSEFQYRRFEELFETVYLSAKDDKFDFEAPLILDRYEISSPLAALVSVFETLDSDAVFILSVDAPFVEKNIIAELLENIEDCDAVIAQSESGSQPLCGIYKRSILPIALKSLEENDHRLGKLLKRVKTKWVSFEDDAAFANLNHPQEYEDAKKLDLQRRETD